MNRQMTISLTIKKPSIAEAAKAGNYRLAVTGMARYGASKPPATLVPPNRSG